MATAEQVQVVADLHQTFTDRDVDGFVSHLTEDAILRPSTLIAGREEYRGIEDVRKGFIEIGEIVASRGEDVSVKPIHFYSDRGDEGAVLSLAKLTITRKDDDPFTTDIAYLWKLDGTKLAELHAWLSWDEGLKQLSDPEEVAEAG